MKGHGVLLCVPMPPLARSAGKHSRQRNPTSLTRDQILDQKNDSDHGNDDTGDPRGNSTSYDSPEAQAGQNDAAEQKKNDPDDIKRRDVGLNGNQNSRWHLLLLRLSSLQGMPCVKVHFFDPGDVPLAVDLG